MDQPAVAIRNLDFSFGRTEVLREVSLEIAPGDFACIVGPNGGGKTTLLRLMLGLLTPDRGEVRIFGRPPGEARATMAYTPQHLLFDPDFPVTAMDVTLMGRLTGGMHLRYNRKDRQAARHALEEVDLAELANRPFSSLSGGQRQRVLIARALASQPDVILLDEPTASLDPHTENELHRLLHDLNERMTLVMVSHDVGFVCEMVHTVICVNRQVTVHPTQHLTGQVIDELYGRGTRAIRHDVSCQEGSR